ncbi:MAG: amino acid deaminase/aldolase [Thermodesulfobacteriota bacterium]
MDYQTARSVLAGERLPAVLVDLEAFDSNVALGAHILRESGGRHTLRLATKSVRVPELIRRVLASSPVYKGLMCYSAEEAALLGSLGFDDLLVAYPTLQASDLTALRRLHEEGRSVCLMADSQAGLDMIARHMEGVARPFRLILDVDMSLRLWRGQVHLGVRRSPVRTLSDVLELFDYSERYKSVKIVGLMGYEAQVAGLGDRSPFNRLQRPLISWIRRRSIRDVSRRRREISETLARRGHRLEIFNGGGTGSLNITAHEPWLTELAAGSGFLCSHLFDYYSNIKFKPACFFACQVVRSSDQGYVTCQGGGYIASGTAGWDKAPRPYLPAGLKLVSTEGCGEVQTPLLVPAGTTLPPGDPVLFRHAKAGEPAERFLEYLLVSEDRIVGRVKTYRGMGYCFF